MAFSYLTEDNIFQVYRDSKQYMLPWFQPLDEFERLARNEPHPKIDPAYPKVTDGTTASIVSKTPKRVIQQLPTGKVTSDTNDWLTIVASFIYTNIIIPHANYQFSLLQKCWNVVERGLTYGACPTYVPFVMDGDYFGTDLSLPYIKNVYVMDGKVSDKDSPVIFMQAFYKEADIDAIIDKEKKLKAAAKESGQQYEATWDIEGLEAIKQECTQKEDQESTPEEKKKGGRSSGIEIVHAMQKGVGAIFYSFNPKTEKIVRRKKNKDPRGVIPIHFFYVNVDGSNPLGRGYVQLVAPIQNLIDAEMQMYQYNRALMLNPPLKKKGNFNKNQIKFQPNVVIDLGSEENADVVPLTIDTQAIANFPQNYGLMKSQLLNLLSSPDTSVSSEVGNPGFSKTDAGVKSQQANVSIDDNYIRKQFETWFSEWSETAINLYFAERSGTETIQLDKKTADRLRRIDAELVNDDDQIVVNYDTATEALKFEVDASTSSVKDDVDQLQRVDALLDKVEQSQLLQELVGAERIQQLWNRIVTTTGVEDPEELQISQDEIDARKQQEDAAKQAAMAQAQAAQIQPPAAQGQEQPQAPAPQQPGQGQEAVSSPEEDQAYAQALLQHGVPQEKIGQAIAMLNHGYPVEQVMQMLGTE